MASTSLTTKCLLKCEAHNKLQWVEYNLKTTDYTSSLSCWFSPSNCSSGSSPSKNSTSAII